MKYVLLDTKILIQFPEITAIGESGFKFIITESTYNWFFQLSINRGLSEHYDVNNFLDYSISAGIIKVLTDYKKQSISHIPTYPQFSYLKLDLISEYHILKKNGEDVIICSDDITLKSYCNEYQIPFWDLFDLKKVVKLIKSNTSAAENLKAYIIDEKKKIAGSLIFALIIFFIIIYLAKLFEAIQINNFTLIFCILILGFSLFIFRDRYRLTYGIIELLLGVASVYLGFRNNINLHEGVVYDLYIKIFGGLYLMVSGLDNIIKSLTHLLIGKKIIAFLNLKID